MKKITIFTAFVFSISIALSQHPEADLLGNCSVSDLEKEPYATWFNPNYEKYIPHPEIVNQLKKSIDKFSFKIVFGSWCGDSKRELPRMIKILRTVGVSENQLQLIGVSDSMAVYKQAPNREEKGLHVYRVPTFIVYQKGKEVGRINEYAVETLERDLLKIVKGEEYIPNYKSYPQVNAWLLQGVLNDDNANPRGLAEQIRSSVSRESDLNACGYVLLMRGEVNEAITVFRININLFPQSSNCFDSLGEAYLVAGHKDNSIACYERAVELDPKNENAIKQLTLLKAGG
jgi:tetratricopeptide (TPR) repeat protein